MGFLFFNFTFIYSYFCVFEEAAEVQSTHIFDNYIQMCFCITRRIDF